MGELNQRRVNQNYGRIWEIDALRGFALIGVLMVNVIAFNTTLFDKIAGHSPLENLAQHSVIWDNISAISIHLLFQGKFYPIFAILFGLSFYLFLQRKNSKSAHSSLLFKRRLLFLLILGIFNLVLVWYGDILHVYSIVGFFLLFFKDKEVASLKKWIIVLLIISFLISFGSELLVSLGEQYGGEEFELIDTVKVEQAREVYKHGDLVEIVQFRLWNEFGSVLSNLMFIAPKIMALFLIGLYLGKTNLYSGFFDKWESIKGAARFSFVASLVTMILYLSVRFDILDLGFYQQSLTVLLFEIKAMVMALWYITMMAYLMTTYWGRKVVYPLRQMGRMALTNYLVQCIVCAFVFYGFGMGYIGKLPLYSGVLFTVILYLVQVLLSDLWLRRYTMGPFEYVWRKFTYYY